MVAFLNGTKSLFKRLFNGGGASTSKHALASERPSRSPNFSIPSARSEPVPERPAPPRRYVPAPVRYVVASPPPPPPPGPYTVILLDVSQSMSSPDYPPSRLEAAKAAIHRFLAKLSEEDPETKVAIVVFSSEARILVSPTSVTHLACSARSYLNPVAPEYQTNAAQGLSLTMSLLPRPPHEGRRRIILLTDGHSNLGGSPEQTATFIKESGAEIQIIGIGGSPQDVNEPQLRRMASVVKGEVQYWFIDSVPDLIRKFEKLALREFK